MNTNCGIYMVTCLANGRRYIGSSRRIYDRWKEHRSDLKHNKHHNPQWQNSYNKYGAHNFEWAILEEMPTSSVELHTREKHWMDLLHPEFNVSLEAFPTRAGVKATPERNEKFSNSMKKMWANLTDDEREAWNKSAREAWAKLTPEEKEKRMSHLVATRNNPTLETREKMRASRLKFIAENPTEKRPRAPRKRYPYKPVTHTPEWEAGRVEREMMRVEKIRKSNLGKKRTESQKKVTRDIANAQWADPEYRAKHQAATLAAMQDPAVIQRLSEARKGYVMPEEQKEKIRASNTGRKRSPETKARLSEARRRMWAEKRANGEADAIRKKIADSKRGQKQSEETKAKKRSAQQARRKQERLTDDT